MGYYTKNGGLIGSGTIEEPTGVHDIVTSQILFGIALDDYTQITDTSAAAFSYFAMPSGPRTMLNYITSFGVDQSSSNDNSGSWPGGYDSITATATPITTNNYFDSGNVDIIKGDGSNDSGDWVIFYFKGGLGDFDGNYSAGGSAWLAGENTASGATNGGSVTVGRVWGYERSTGWNLLYLLTPLSGNGQNKNQSNWWNSGTTVTSGAGKYTAYDNLNITHFGFSVGTS